MAADVQHQAGQSDLVGRGADRGPQGGGDEEGTAQRIGHPVETAADPDHCSRLEGGELQGGQIQPVPHLGIAGEKDLETAVEQEAVHPVRADASPDPVGGLEDPALDAGPVQVLSTAQPGQAGTHDHHVGRRAGPG